jgi:hypothetical protein
LGAVVLVVVVGAGEVEVVAFDAAGEARVAAFPVQGVVSEDEGLVQRGALGLVQGGGIPVAEMPCIGVGEGDGQPLTVGADGVDPPGVGIDAGDGGQRAVEEPEAVVVAGGESSMWSISAGVACA